MADAVHTPGSEEVVDPHGHDPQSHALHEQNPFLGHHWDTPAQQFDAGKLGMWLFLATEILFFAGLFCAYAVLRKTHPEIFIVGQHFLDVFYGGLNTVVLILSSFTMAMGVWCAQTSRKTGLIVCLILTLIGAATFMVVKYIEYKHKFDTGVIWGQNFNPVEHGPGHGAGAHGAAGGATGGGGHAAAGTQPAGGHSPTAPAHPATASAASTPAAHTPPAAPAPSATRPAATGPSSGPAAATASAPASAPVLEISTIKLAPAGPTGTVVAAATDAGEHGPKVDPYAESKKRRDVHLFIAVYFCLTGLHGIHVIGGMVAITTILVLSIKGRFNSNYYTPVDLVGLYWHVVDLVWIFLFPLLYLIH